MSRLTDLINQIENKELRKQIKAEVNKLSKQKKFGLVYEEHSPECSLLYDVEIRVNSRVVERAGNKSDIYIVRSITGDKALCEHTTNHTRMEFTLDEIVTVVMFGEPIYPFLKPIDSICNSPETDLWHVLIEAENYYALQFLEYLYAEKVDCIIIDPPYNKKVRDWKYNNDYVDSSDMYRHSKWLSFMEKRLKLAKRLLNPQNSVLIVTIDEKEYLHLGCLLEEIFPEAKMQMISSVINPAGVSRGDQFSRTDEYIFFLTFGECAPCALELEKDWLGKTSKNKDKLHWNILQRTGVTSLRTDRPNMFYPIFIKEDGSRIESVGESIPLDVERESVIAPEGQIAIWPLYSDGREGRWRVGRDTLVDLIRKHYVRIGQVKNNRAAISYLSRGEQVKVENGDFPITGYRPDGSIIVDESKYKAKFIPGTQWWIKSHDASLNGTKLLNKIIGPRFTFPKSLYAVHDALNFFVHNKPEALIVDFFAGSGTTLHAVNLLNAEDDGHRQCILITNNEVSNAEVRSLTKQGYKPGDEEWEKLGIAHYVMWPRTVCSIEGHDINGIPLKGSYHGSEIPMAQGFRANAAFFKLGFLDMASVRFGKKFNEMLPTLWMKAGCYSVCPTLTEKEIPKYLILPKNRMAILNDNCYFAEFSEKVKNNPLIEVVFLVTDSDDDFRSMASVFSGKQTYQMYRDYLDYFRVTSSRSFR